MKNKLKNYVLKIIDMSPKEIALAGIFVGLYTLFNMPFLKIIVPGMQISLKYPFIILMGLLLKPFLALLASIIADNLSVIINGAIGAWSWQYAIIAPGIVIIALVFKHMLSTKSEKIWWASNVFLFLAILASAAVFAYVYYSHPTRYKILSNSGLKIVFIVLLSLIMIAQFILTFFYWYTKTKVYRNVISIFGIVFIVVILSIWAWGPIAFMIYLKRTGATIKVYNFYLIQRILKTPFIVPLYIAIITPIYQAAIIVKAGFDKKNSW